LTYQLNNEASRGMISQHHNTGGTYDDGASTQQHVPVIKGQKPMMVNSNSEVMKKKTFINQHMKTANVS